MATLLYRIGRWAYSRPWRVLLAWVVVIAGVGTAAVLFGGKTAESYAIPGTESQEAIDKLAAVFPQTAGASIQVAREAPGAPAGDAPPYLAAIQQQADELGKVGGVAAVATP